MIPHDINMNREKDKSWHAVTVTTPQEGGEWISHALFELGSVGNIEENPPDPAMISMKGYFPSNIADSSAITRSIIGILRERGIEPVSISSTTIKLQNWAEAAQQMFSPIKILKDTTIISPWSNYKASDGEKTIVINPGMAFGTGYHATTRLAARLVDKIFNDEVSPSPMRPCHNSNLCHCEEQSDEAIQCKHLK